MCVFLPNFNTGHLLGHVYLFQNFYKQMYKI